jgi:hypothetical protein
MSGLNLDAPMVHNLNYTLVILLIPLLMALILYIGSKITQTPSLQAKVLQYSKTALC